MAKQPQPSKQRAPTKSARSPVEVAAQQATGQQSVLLPIPSKQVVTELQQYSGLIPPPGMLKDFDAWNPGTGSRIIQWAEDEQKYRQRLESEAQAANIAAQQRQLSIAEYQMKGVFRSDLIGQALGFLVCIGCIGGAIFLGFQGQTAVALGLAAIPTGAVIYAFRGHLFGNKSKQPSK